MDIFMLLDKKGEQDKTRKHLIIADKYELSLLIEIVEGYCITNPKKKKAKDFLKTLEDSLLIFG